MSLYYARHMAKRRIRRRRFIRRWAFRLWYVLGYLLAVGATVAFMLWGMP